MYVSTFSLNSALDGDGGQRLAPAALRIGKTQYPLHRRLGGSQGRSGQDNNKEGGNFVCVCVCHVSVCVVGF